MKVRLVSLFAFVLLMALALGFVSAPLGASPCFEIERVYYSDATKTVIVGGFFWPCNGPPEQWGQVTSFRDIYSSDCPGCYA